MRVRALAFNTVFAPMLFLAATVPSLSVGQSNSYARFPAASSQACASACTDNQMCASWSFGRGQVASGANGQTGGMCSFSSSSQATAGPNMVSGLPRRDGNAPIASGGPMGQMAYVSSPQPVAGGRTGWEVRPAPWLSSAPAAPRSYAPPSQVSAPVPIAPVVRPAPTPPQNSTAAPRAPRIEFDPEPTNVSRPTGAIAPPMQPAPQVPARPTAATNMPTPIAPPRVRQSYSAPTPPLPAREVAAPAPMPAMDAPMVSVPRATTDPVRVLIVPPPPPRTQEIPANARIVSTPTPPPAPRIAPPTRAPASRPQPAAATPRVALPPAAPTTPPAVAQNSPAPSVSIALPARAPSRPVATTVAPAPAPTPAPVAARVTPAAPRVATKTTPALSRRTPASPPAPAVASPSVAATSTQGAPARQEVAVVPAATRAAARGPVKNPYDPESFRGADGMIDAAEMRRAQLNASREQGTPAYSVQREWEAIAAEGQRAEAAGEVRRDPLAGTVPVAPPPETRAERRAREAAEAEEEAQERRANGEEEAEPTPTRPAASRTRATPRPARQSSATTQSQPRQQASVTPRRTRPQPPQAIDREPRLSGGPGQ